MDLQRVGLVSLSLNIDFCRHIRRCQNTRILPWETVVEVLLQSLLSLRARCLRRFPYHLS
jgi:hypothetical protein